MRIVRKEGNKGIWKLPRQRLFVLSLLALLEISFACSGVKLTLAQTNQTLIIGTTDSVMSSLDPANAFDYFGWEIIRSLGSGLVDYRPGATGPGDIIPDLATNWNVSPDGLNYTFSLRQGVKYDDGTEFNATHVKYTFDRDIEMADPNGPFVGIGFGDIIQNISVVDTYTVRFDLRIPFSPFLSLMTGAECVMVDPKYAPMHGTSWDPATDVVLYVEGDARASNPMGLGPYTLANWTRVAGRDTLMVLAANPNYWNASAGMPKTRNIVIQFYGTSSTLALAIQNGEVDVAFRQLSVTDIKTLQSNPNLHVWNGPGNFIQYMCLQERYWPFNETSIRKAVGAAINRTMLVSMVFQGQAQNLYTLIPVGMAYHKDVFQNLGDPNYTRTQELLAPYGYNATNKFTFDLYYETSGHYPQSSQVAQVLKASIEASGVITVNLEGLEWAVMGSARRTGTMPAFVYGWYPDYIDPDDYIQPFLQTSGGTWLNLNYSNPEMDQLIAWARANITDWVRNALYEDIQDLMVTDCPIIPLYQASSYAVSTPEIEGIYLDISSLFRYWYLERAGAPTRLVGVNVGDKFRYSVAASWNSDDPNATVPFYIVDYNNTEWMEISITAISLTNVTGQMTARYKNGTEESWGGWIDIDTGDNANMTYMIISGNLSAGDSLYTSSFATWFINETVPKTYLSGVRDTNLINMTLSTETQYLATNLYWDKLTGVLVDLFAENTYQTGNYTTSWSVELQIISSDLWVVPEFSTWPPVLLMFIAFTLATVVIARKKQRVHYS